ncbi:hypothetical protein FKW77_007584 [Venturia effusa]|uniref:Uncharacterized protein n=1 Tax=Venturia effusa TaxID=50376 RepID=A0A517L9K6_9PEZI|nr:hypothetical protein FKW77_007584 [Venturia effusa]
MGIVTVRDLLWLLLYIVLPAFSKPIPNPYPIAIPNPAPQGGWSRNKGKGVAKDPPKEGSYTYKSKAKPGEGTSKGAFNGPPRSITLPDHPGEGTVTIDGSPPPPPGACVEENPLVYYNIPHPEFVVDISIAQNPEQWKGVSGYFKVVINPSKKTIRGSGCEIFIPHQGRVSPNYTPYLIRLPLETGQDRARDENFEIGINSGRQELTTNIGNNIHWDGVWPRVNMHVQREEYRHAFLDSWRVTWYSFRQFAFAVFLAHDYVHNCG